MFQRNIPRLTCWFALMLVSFSVAACSDESTGETTPEQAGPPLLEPDIESTPVSASFSVTVDAANEALAEETLEPKAQPVSISGDSEVLSVAAFVKRLPARDGLLWVELYLENLGETGLREVHLEVTGLSGATDLYDFTNNPFAEPTSERKFVVGRISREGVGKIVLGIPDTGGLLDIELTVSGVSTKREATSSAPLAISPDGAEAWVAFADGDVVSVLDTATDARVSQIKVEGRPSSVAITPDGKFVLVAAASANTVTVIDRASRKVTQTLGEGDGIGREPKHIVLSPDGGRAFVSAYVGDSIASLVRNETRFWFEKSVFVGRRPAGMSVSPDSGTLYVSHFLPRGTVSKNEGWVTTLSTESLTVSKEVVIEDPFNSKQVKCLADVFGVSASRLVTEATPSELWGVFLNPSGTEAWIPGTRVAGATVVWERGPNSAPLAAAASIRTGELLAPFQMLLDTRVSAEAEIALLPGVLDPPDVNLDFVSCARLGHEVEQISRDLIPSSPGQQVNRAAAFPAGTTALSEAGVGRFVGFSRGGRRTFTVATISDEIAVTDGMTHHPVSQLHVPLSGSNPVGMALTPDGAKAYVLYANSTFASVLDLAAYAKEGALPGPSYVPYVFRDVPDFPSAPGALTGKRLVRTITDVPMRPPISEVGRSPLSTPTRWSPKCVAARCYLIQQTQTNIRPCPLPDSARARVATLTVGPMAPCGVPWRESGAPCLCEGVCSVAGGCMRWVPIPMPRSLPVSS